MISAKVGDVHVGIYYELPDGRIAYTYGANGINKTVSYYFDDDEEDKLVTYSELASWTKRKDLRDFPNARDPRLPYVFDLFWDIKYMSDLRRELVGHRDEEEIRQAILENNIEL